LNPNRPVDPKGPVSARAKRRLPWDTIGMCVGFTLLGLALGWLLGTKGHAAHASASGTAGIATRAEFQAIATKLFTSPGGLMDRTRSGILKESLKTTGLSVQRELSWRIELVQALLREGAHAEAAEAVEALFTRAAGLPGVIDNEPRFQRLRAQTYLRLAETENCVDRHNHDCCVFPLKGGGVHSEKSPAEQAAASYLAFLAKKPDDMSGRWLLNITHMAMGTYPDSVPPQYLVPEIGPNSSSDFPRFTDVAVEAGFSRKNHAGGVVIEDMDGDGVLDVVLSCVKPDVPLAWFRGRGDGTFEDRAAGTGLDDQLGGLNVVATDYDNDGDIDLLVLRGAWLFEEGRIRKSLLRNDGGGKFTDVTREAGLAEPLAPTQVGVWFDYDNDGDLDLFVGNESRSDPTRYPEKERADYPCNLFRNEGNGKFTEVARAAGVTNDQYCKGASAGDYDNDGWMDLYVSNMGPNRLYHNNRDGTFTDVAPKLGVTEPVGRSVATWFFDFDNDGNLDIFVGAYDTDIEVVGSVASWQMGQPGKFNPPRLYRNKGDGTFEDVTRAAELWRPIAPMGANFGDLDNDGWLDVYLTTGSPDYEFLTPDVMLRNAGGRRFADVTVAGGFGNLQKGHGAAFADLDGDGDQDVFHEVGGFYEGDAFFNSLYENPGNQNHFLVLKLEGRKSNRLAYGARIKVVVDTPAGERAIHRAVGSVSSFGGSPSRQEIGLGNATAIRSVEISWPASGIRQNLAKLELDSSYDVVEGDDVPHKIALQRVKLGGK
jgi:hypothetical protein